MCLLLLSSQLAESCHCYGYQKTHSGNVIYGTVIDFTSSHSTLLTLGNASSKRSISALKKVKTYLCSTMSQDRLNHIILLHCYKDLTDSLDLAVVVNEFVDLSSCRLGIFGLFTNEDYIAVGFCGRRKTTLKCLSIMYCTQLAKFTACDSAQCPYPYIHSMHTIANILQ